MSAPVLQVATCAVLLTVSGVWGAPFASEEEANQFLRLKRQAPYSQSYWDPSSSQNAWGFTVAEQAVESWTALRTTAQYYMDLGSFSFYPDTTSLGDKGQGLLSAGTMCYGCEYSLESALGYEMPDKFSLNRENSGGFANSACQFCTRLTLGKKGTRFSRTWICYSNLELISSGRRADTTKQAAVHRPVIVHREILL